MKVNVGELEVKGKSLSEEEAEVMLKSIDLTKMPIRMCVGVNSDGEVSLLTVKGTNIEVQAMMALMLDYDKKLEMALLKGVAHHLRKGEKKKGKWFWEGIAVGVFIVANLLFITYLTLAIIALMDKM